MAFNIQRRTSDIANVVVADASRNVTLPADLTVTALVNAGLIKANAQGKLVAAVAGTDYGLGTVTSVGLSSATSGVTIGSTPVTTSGTITLTIATASGSQQGLLSSTDWTTFNNKQNALTNPVTGTGTTNYIPKWTSSSALGNSGLISDSNNNLGLGVTPSAWGSGSAIDINSRGSIAYLTTAGQFLAIANNSFWNGTNYKYKETAGASQINLGNDGSYAFLQAASGTAGNNITFSQPMTLTANGRLLLGTTTEGTDTLLVSGTIRVTGGGTFTNSVDISDSTATLETGKTLLSLSANSSASLSIIVKPSNTSSDIIYSGSSGGLISGSISHAWQTRHSFGAITERMRLTSDGRLGIGTDNPEVKLHVAGTGDLFIIGETGASAKQSLFSQVSTGSGYLRIQSVHQNTAWTPIVLNPSGGNVLVGTSTDYGQKLVVNGTSRLIDNVTTFGANGIELLWSGNTQDDQRQGRIRPISTPNVFPYAGGLAFDYYSYNGTAYQYYEGLRLNGNGEAIFYGRTTISSGYIADKSGTGNNTGISFGASAIFSTNGSGTSTAKDLGSSASPWGAAYLSSRSFINGAAGYLFDVQENGSNKARLQTYVESNVVSLIAGYDTTAVPFSIYTGGSERFIIDTSGKVAIGSANTNRTGYDANGRTLTLYGPQRSALELGSETPVNSTQLGAVNFLSSTTVKAQIISDLDGSGNANLVFSLAGSSRAVITPNGRLLLGTTTEGSELLQVNGTSRFTGSITIDDTGTAVLSAQGNASTNFFINSRSTLTFQTGGAYGASTTRLTIGSTGAATFSSTLGINGVSDNIKSGEYTPTLTNVGNISSSSLASFKFFYIRIGSYVHVSGAVSITPTVANNGTYLGISLPISSNLGSGDVNGNTNSYIYGYGYVQEDTVNDRAEVFFQPNSTTAGQVWKLNFTYKIV